MKIHLIYLAAGSARRFGSNKLLHPVGGKPLFLYGLEALQAAVQTRTDCAITVVSRYPEIRAEAQARGLRAADSPLSEQGLSFTIRAGLDAVSPLAPDDYLLFLVADQPGLRPQTVAALLDAAREGTPLACVRCGGQVGNPTLFSAAYAPELAALTGDRGGRKVLLQHEDDCRYIDIDDVRELADIDLPEQLQ